VPVRFARSRCHRTLVLPFWISIAVLSLAQGLLVAAPGAIAGGLPASLRSRRWALIPPLSVIVFVFGARAAERASAQGLTYLALVAVPLLAVLALGWMLWGAQRPLWPPSPRLLLVLPLFALAWGDRGGLAGDAAALALSALSCVALGVLLATVTPRRWLAAGIVAMAIADTALVVSDLLQRPNNALNAARPAAGLPQLQEAVFGSAVMGYGDLFIAGVLGGLLAASVGRSAQLRAAALTATLALGFDLLFFAVDELPATVPVALALMITMLRRRWRSDGERRSREDPQHAAPPGPPRPPARAAR
jgi:hypothetical protein